MFIDFNYPDIVGVEIPERNLLGVFEPNEMKQKFSVSTLTKEALLNPINFDNLGEKLTSADKILLLSDDNTRSTPVDEILQVLLPYLLELGIKKENITILMALGTHRPMSKKELIKKLGQQIVSEYRVINHLWDLEDQNIYYGKTSGGIEVWGNKLLSENDFIIGLGHIVPHRVAGFSGGGKIVQPGVANGISTGETHWLSALVSGSEIMGIRDNSVREQIDEAAKLMGLEFIINVVQDSKGSVVGVFAGDFIEAHKAGCEMAKEVYGVIIPKADIVITDSFPADIELWQAAKGIFTSELVVKKGGCVILVTPCPEGVSVTHPEIEEIGYKTLVETQELLEKKILKEKSVAAHLVHVGSIIKEKAFGIMVCPNISNELKERIGFIPADSVQDALSYALDKIGNNSSIAVVLHGGEILPIN